MDSNGWKNFSEINLTYALELYERYHANPDAVDVATRELFQRLGPPPASAPTTNACFPDVGLTAVDWAKVCTTMALATAIRAYGYRAARLDPLGSEPPGDPALLPENHCLSERDLAGLPATVVGGPVVRDSDDAHDAIRLLRSIYEGSSGFEFEHVPAEERTWLRDAVESRRFRPPKDPIDELRLLERLTHVEAFERFLHVAFPTQTRFSIEGLDIMVPQLEEIIGAAAEIGTRSVLLGMAHRGRLNVLVHVLGKPYVEILAEFQGSVDRPSSPTNGVGGAGWTGDVKYHLGARRALKGGHAVEMSVALPPNPSHLEFVDPVIEGMTRAGSEMRDNPGAPEVDDLAALAILVHGEAAFVGEGIVAETLNLSQLPGYRSGGTVHLIANNQLGFTTTPQSGRSTRFASDLAKGFEIPIIHVNADDPEACIAAARLGHAYVERFHKDVVIDVIGYRRWGHNEGDEPSFTQPVMYRAIAEHPRVREVWLRDLTKRGIVTTEDAERMLRDATENLYALRRTLSKDTPQFEDGDRAGLNAGGERGGLGHSGPAGQLSTAVEREQLAALNEEVLAVPQGFALHPKLQPLYLRRHNALRPESQTPEHPRIDWGHAEALALASILADGVPVRFSGQDTSRGTFGQRHLLLHDVETGEAFAPLQHLRSARASCAIWDSPLSEQATLGFEFGYSLQAPDALVLWEAQYGDFTNAAQVIVDEFVSSARSKWSHRVAPVLLLPHGYEGQGPDHSSARPERFLQLAAEDNLRIANCTTAAQYFHILRRQAQLLTIDPRPLVLFTPKSLLRHALAASPIEELAAGQFQPVIDDVESREEPQAIHRLLLCTGHVFADLEAARATGDRAKKAAAIVRVEELYPFPANELTELTKSYPSLKEVVWVQEEPRNMGAWTYVAPRLRDILEGRLPLSYVGRTRRASPSEGSYEWHVREQSRLVEDAFPRVRAARASQ